MDIDLNPQTFKPLKPLNPSNPETPKPLNFLMQLAERLYISGYISYPRTESSAYPKSFDVRATLAEQRSHPVWGDYVTSLLAIGPLGPKGGTDAGDHPPITPVRQVGLMIVL
jgi:DNA topoisomerase IA